MDIRAFPVLTNYHMRKTWDIPRVVPWDFVEKFRAQAEKNHGQTLERLAERGGLDPTEMYLASRGLGFFSHGIDEKTLVATSVAWLLQASKEGETAAYAEAVKVLIEGTPRAVRITGQQGRGRGEG